MSKPFILSSVIIAAMMSLTSCNTKTEPEVPQITKEEVIGDWHYNSGTFLSVPGLEGETTYHVDLTLSNSGDGKITGWYEDDVNSLASLSADLRWTLENNILGITTGGTALSYALFFTGEGNLHIIHPDYHWTDFRRNMFSNLEAELMEKAWLSPTDCKGQETMTYIIKFGNENVCTYTVEDIINRINRHYTYCWELKDTTLSIWNTDEKTYKRFEWPVKFINTRFSGLDKLAMQK